MILRLRFAISSFMFIRRWLWSYQCTQATVCDFFGHKRDLVLTFESHATTILRPKIISMSQHAFTCPSCPCVQWRFCSKSVAHVAEIKLTYDGNLFDIPGGCTDGREPATRTAERETFKESGYEAGIAHIAARCCKIQMLQSADCLHMRPQTFQLHGPDMRRFKV